jgi:hypothetical protein
MFARNRIPLLLLSLALLSLALLLVAWAPALSAQQTAPTAPPAPAKFLAPIPQSYLSAFDQTLPRQE